MNLRKRASLGLVVILIAATLGIFAYVMANGSTPVGPPIPSPTGSSLDISVLGVPVVTSATEIDYTDGNICVVDAGGGIAETELCEDVNIADRLSIHTVDGEYIDIIGTANLLFSGRDGFNFMLDNNNNTSNSTLCIRANAVETNRWCVDESGNITLATIDGDLNTFVDIKPDSFDSIDAGADEECATYEGTNTIEWADCISLFADLPFSAGQTVSTTDYQGLPGYTFRDTTTEFVVVNDIHYTPFQTVNDITINRASFQVSSAGGAGDACRLGLYTADANWQPGTLIADWGQVVNDSTGWKHATVNTSITRGRYMTAFICDSAPGLYMHLGSSYLSDSIDTSTTSFTRYVKHMRVSAPTNDPFNNGFAASGEDWDAATLTSTSGNAIAVVLRWS
jgi:hypothetical protein